MTDGDRALDLLPPGTPVTNCEREPIHVPGSIALVAVRLLPRAAGPAEG